MTIELSDAYIRALDDWSDIATALFASRYQQQKLELAYEIATFTLELVESEQANITPGVD